MKKTVLILTACFFATIEVLAQNSTSAAARDQTYDKSNAVTFGINIPVGEFSKTHFAGIGLGYSWSHHRFGNLQVLPKKLIGFTADGSIDYYFGKKETVGGFDYRYSGYVYLHAFGGAIFNPCKKVNTMLVAGPTMGIYKESTDAGFGAKFSGNYFLTEKIGLGSGITFLKHKYAGALWVAGIWAAWSF